MAGTATYQSMRMASQARDNEEKKTQERKKALLVLICRHLCDHGYVETAERLQSEGGAGIDVVWERTRAGNATC
jgi:hypothetical protein